MVRSIVLVLVALALMPSGLAAQEPRPALLIEAGKVVTIRGAPLESARILVRNGVIASVGVDVPRPTESRVLDARALTVTPGFVLAATSIGMPSAPAPPAGQPEPLRAELKLEVKAVDELRARDEGFELLLDAGFTTAGILPIGDQPGIPGQSSAISTRVPGTAPDVLSPEAALVVYVATHGAWRKAVSSAFGGAEKAEKEASTRKKARKKDDDSTPPPPKGPLAAALARKRQVLLLPGDLPGWGAARDAMPLVKLELDVVDGTDLYLDAASFKGVATRVLTYPVLIRERGTRLPLNRAARWEAMGVPYAFLLPDDRPEDASLMRDAAIEMVRTGCTAKGVLEALTTVPAAALGISDKVGSIEPGRRADLLFWSGDPLDPTSRLVAVMVAGEMIPRLSRAVPVAP